MCARRIETSASRTADMTCGCRALSYFERDPLYKGEDWVAPLLLPRKLQPFVKIGLTRKVLRNILGPEGVYEWVIARTRYIDEAFRTACTDRFSQILLFGAGFDSRGVRFKDKTEGLRLFELDAPTTQEMKVNQFRLRSVQVPPNVTFVPINFEKESIGEKLCALGFKLHQKTLVILEGVLQYLNAAAVEATFATIHDLAGPGSRVVFDHAYAFVLRGEGNVYGQERMVNGVKSFGESWQFGLDEAELTTFVQKYGLVLIDQKNPHQLEEMNFMREDGTLVGRVNGTQGIASAEFRT